MHLERELATKLGLFQTIFKDVPVGCTDFLINNAQEVGNMSVPRSFDSIPEMDLSFSA